MNPLSIAIIIPTFNEAERIGALLTYLRTHAPAANIWVANSPKTSDDTAAIAQQMGVRVLDCPQAGRAEQMNYAAQQCNTDILYFVHADVFPPPGFTTAITKAQQDGYTLGYFSYRFDCNRPLLRLNSWCTQRQSLLSGGGDQTLFITTTAFQQLGGFDETLPIMEDFDLVWRARAAGLRPHLICEPALVSARKFEQNSWLKVNVINLLTFGLFGLKAPAAWLVAVQRWLD